MCEGREMSFSAEWEDRIYSQGKQVNKYPYGELISVFFNSLKFLDSNTIDKSAIKVLELGCGTGNNLWFFSELGFDTYGIDGSQRACDLANNLCQKRGVKVNVQKAYFDNLPFENQSVDIVVDREATYCGTLKSVKNCWKEVNRVLKRGGLVISFMFSDQSLDCIRLKQGLFKGTEIESNTFKDVEQGAFAHSGTIHFATFEELFQIFDFCDIKVVSQHSSKILYNVVESKFYYDEYIIIGVKK